MKKLVPILACLFYLFTPKIGLSHTRNLSEDLASSFTNIDEYTMDSVGEYSSAYELMELSSNLDTLLDHINGVTILSTAELNALTIFLVSNAEELGADETIIRKAIVVVNAYDTQVGPLFTTEKTKKGFKRKLSQAVGFELEFVMMALQQGLFDFAFTQENYAKYPTLIGSYKYKTSAAFPGDIDPSTDANLKRTISIRADFKDPFGFNTTIASSDRIEHALRPTGLYLAPGTVATVTVPASLVGKGYKIKVGVINWNLNNRPNIKRLDSISKNFEIEATSVKVFNPMGGVTAIIVPIGSADGILELSVQNGVEAPFFSLKSFYEIPDFDAERLKPAAWAVFETDNVMFIVPTHFIKSQTSSSSITKAMKDWDFYL